MRNNTPSALITGASRGIGRAIALKLAEQGCKLLLNARTAADLQALRSLITSRYPDAQVTVVAADLQRHEELDALIEQFREVEPAPYLLINNVGIFQPGPLLQDPPGRLEQMMQLNVYAAYHLVRAFVPAMVERGSGHVFNICSVASREAFADRGAYVITKHALLGLSRALRAEVAHTGVRVSAILPGPTATSSWSEAEKPVDKQLMPPEDIASMLWAAYQLSDASVAEEIVLRPKGWA